MQTSHVRVVQIPEIRFVLHEDQLARDLLAHRGGLGLRGNYGPEYGHAQYARWVYHRDDLGAVRRDLGMGQGLARCHDAEIEVVILVQVEYHDQGERHHVYHGHPSERHARD